MFRNEEEKMRLYRSNLKKEAKNQFLQGQKLEEYLLYERGIEAQEKGTARFADAIGEAIGSNMRVVGVVDKIKNWASKTGSKDQLDVDEFGSVLKAKSKKAPKSVKQPSKPMKMISNNKDLEGELMGKEDINLNALVPSSKKATSSQLKEQADAQAQLDLIALFQQDVKEGRKRQALMDLAQLNEDEDKRLRQKFMTVLEELEDKNEKARSKKEYQEQKAILDKMMDLIEKQRMHDSFIEFSSMAMKNELASKIQRNLVAAMSNKKLMKGVKTAIKNKKTKEVDDFLTSKDMSRKYESQSRQQEMYDMGEEDKLAKKVKAATTIAERMAQLRARKKKTLGTPDTSVSSDAPQTLDRRQFNKGRPKKDTNVELEQYIDKLIEYNQSSGPKRRAIRDELKNMIARQPNKDYAKRMRDFKDALKRN